MLINKKKFENQNIKLKIITNLFSLFDEGAVRPVIASNGVPFLQMRSVGLHTTSGRKKEGNKERTG